jgi:sulfoxide reductase heme-binding subunit YedZ
MSVSPRTVAPTLLERRVPGGRRRPGGAVLTGLLRDPAGRLSALKTVTLLLVLWPALALALRWQMHDLGARPINEAIHVTGHWAVRFLLITLAVTPARMVLAWPRVVMLRRMIGVTTACYAGLHLLLYVFDQQGNLAKVGSEIVLRFYLTIGFVALLGLLVLAITSTNAWQRRLKRNWKRLHRLVYVIAILALLHYFLQSKANVADATFAAGVFCWLMFWRLAPTRWRGRLLPLPALALAAGLATALVEAAWYGLATSGVDPLVVLAANLDVTFGPRPAVWVLVAGLGVATIAALLAAWRWARPSVRRPA